MRESNTRLLLIAILFLGLFSLNALAGSAVFFVAEDQASEMYTGKLTEGWFFADLDGSDELFVEGAMVDGNTVFMAEDGSCGLVIVAEQLPGGDSDFVVSAPEDGTDSCTYENGKSVLGRYVRN